MRYDPMMRLEKYKALIDALGQRGFLGVVGVKELSPDAMFVSHPSFEDEVMQVRARERGWLVLFRQVTGRWRGWGSLHHISHLDQIPPLCEAVLEKSDRAGPRPSQQVIEHFGLVPIESDYFDIEENSKRWRRFGWSTLPEEQVEMIERSFQSHFKPHGSLLVPSPFVAWQVKDGPQISEEAYELAETKLTLHALSSFRSSVLPGEELLVIDWLHYCYLFDVDERHGIRTAYRDEWAAPILSYGEDASWFTRDCRFGLFALRDGFFAVFGEPFMSEFSDNLPKQELLRADNRVGNWRPEWHLSP